MKKISLVPLVLAGVLTLSACGSGQESASFVTGSQPGAQGSAASAEPAAQSAAPAAASPAVTADDVTQESAAEAGVDLANVKPLASVTVPAIVQGDPDATMDVSLLSLKRDGRTLVATYSFLVNSDVQNPEPEYLYSYLGDQGWYPFLVDTQNLTRHDVLEGAGRRAATAYQGQEFLPGQTFYAFAVFAAPPEDVTSITATIVDGSPAVTQVPIQ